AGSAARIDGAASPTPLSFLFLLLISAPINQPPTFPLGDEYFLSHEGSRSHTGTPPRAQAAHGLRSFPFKRSTSLLPPAPPCGLFLTSVPYPLTTSHLLCSLACPPNTRPQPPAWQGIWETFGEAKRPQMCKSARVAWEWGHAGTPRMARAAGTGDPCPGLGAAPSPGLAPAARAAGETLLTCPELLSTGWAPEHMLSRAAGAARRGGAALAPSLPCSLARSLARSQGHTQGLTAVPVLIREATRRRSRRETSGSRGVSGSGSGSGSARAAESPGVGFRRAAAAPAATPEGTGGCWPGRDRGSWAQMPIEIVCKIKFAGEDAKPKEKEAGDEQSLLGAARGAAAPRDLATFASTSTLHGLGRACGPGPHGLRRTLWALALLTSLAAFLYQAAGLARGYLTRPHLVVMDPAAPAPVAGFPAVTLCNINRFRHSALSDADIFHLANLTGLPPKDRDGHRAAGLRYPEPDMVDILNRTGHQLADMLKSCNFSGHHCSASNFS
ncbi:hypothetical protein EI555_017148, partial [Monodon monoceros]